MISMTRYKKSKRSTGGNGNCVEVRGQVVADDQAVIKVRDTQNRGQGSIDVAPSAFATLAALLKASQ